MLSVSRLEDLMLNMSAPSEQLLYDGWLLRFSPHDIKRAQSVAALYSTLPVAEKIQRTEQLYRQAGLPPLFRISPLSQPRDLDQQLDLRSYRRFETSSVQVASLEPPFGEKRGDLRFERAQMLPWLEHSSRLHGFDDASRESLRHRLEIAILPSTYLTVWHGDKVAACGRVAVDGDTGGLLDVITEESIRGKGIGSALTAALLQIAYEQGARTAWLAVLADNPPALAVYRKLGFRPVYEYWYRIGPL
jgi:GNAT superfamily N-acetyltransferase